MLLFWTWYIVYICLLIILTLTATAFLTEALLSDYHCYTNSQYSCFRHQTVIMSPYIQDAEMTGLTQLPPSQLKKLWTSNFLSWQRLSNEVIMLQGRNRILGMNVCIGTLRIKSKVLAYNGKWSCLKCHFLLSLIWEFINSLGLILCMLVIWTLFIIFNGF